MRRRSRTLVAATLLIVAACLAAACRDRDKPSLRTDEPSHAADAIIEKAGTPEERRALEGARDEVDREMRQRVRALDDEIEALRRENQELARRLRDP